MSWVQFKTFSELSHSRSTHDSVLQFVFDQNFPLILEVVFHGIAHTGEAECSLCGAKQFSRQIRLKFVSTRKSLKGLKPNRLVQEFVGACTGNNYRFLASGDSTSRELAARIIELEIVLQSAVRTKGILRMIPD